MKKYFVLFLILNFYFTACYAYNHHGYYEQYADYYGINQIGPTAPLTAAYGRTFARVDAWVDAYQTGSSYSLAFVYVFDSSGATTGYIGIGDNTDGNCPGINTTFYNVYGIYPSNYNGPYSPDFWMAAFKVSWYYDWDY